MKWDVCGFALNDALLYWFFFHLFYSLEKILLYVINQMVLPYLCWCLLESIHYTSLSSPRFTRLPFSTWPLMCRAVVPTARALPSSSPLPLVRRMQPSPGMLFSPCLPDSQCPGSLLYDKTGHRAKWR